MQIIGHRGAAGLALENSRAAFKAAIDAGVDWIEFDVRQTKDGRVVVSHDPHTLRTGRKLHLIAYSDYSKLRSVKLRGGHTILTIAEAFNAIGGQAKINVELKTPGCAEAVAQNIERMVKNHGASYSDFLVSSFWVPQLKELHRINSHIPLGLLHTFLRPYKFLRLKGLRVQAVGFSQRRLPMKAIYQAELRELMIYVYTVNSLKKAKKFAKIGVNAIVTNRPDKMQAVRGKTGGQVE